MEALKDKVVLITGASSGIGAATALEFARWGASMSLTGRDTSNLERVASECMAQGLSSKQVAFFTGDLINDEDIKSIVNFTVTKFGRIDILVNNAGVSAMGTVDEMDMHTFDSLFAVNVRAVIALTKYCLSHLKITKGNIINVSSCSSVLPSIGEVGYCMTKSALDMFTKGLSLELARSGIRVNSVNPGEVKTDIQRRSGIEEAKLDQYYKDSGNYHPLGRCGEPVEVARVITFLASGLASFMTGAITSVDGGVSNTAAWTMDEMHEHGVK